MLGYQIWVAQIQFNYWAYGAQKLIPKIGYIGKVR